VVVGKAVERETVAGGVLVRVAERRVVNWAVAGRAAGAVVGVMGIMRSRSRREWRMTYVHVGRVAHCERSGGSGNHGNHIH
jgi:hypothetical protein